MLINTLLPLFGLIALGFACVRLRVIPAEGVAPMGAVVVRLALPALIFLTLAATPPAEAIEPWLLVAYGGGTLATILLCLAVARLVLRLDWPECAVVMLGVALSNSGFLGFPVTEALFGAEMAGRLLAHCLLVENLLVIPLGLAALTLADGAGGRPGASLWSGIAAGLWRNPLVLALAAGLAVSGLGVALPTPIETLLQMLARISAPLALLVIGGILASLQAQRAARAVGLLVVGKLLIHPAAVWSALSLSPLVLDDLFAGAVIYAAMPMVTIFPILAARGGQTQTAAMALVLATLGCFVTLPLLLVALL
ncbi:MAG: AEC family transporter [Rhodobacteraceae bacterium]|nr:AEC family transporter [Paracoccaceae bacterium]